ncbi:hypothetical protein Pelo_15713 [Pelomyxa schiedti]|nr:hypothetical protein Pelo_15713 [Pelomyxa schiedti]
MESQKPLGISTVPEEEDSILELSLPPTKAPAPPTASPSSPLTPPQIPAPSLPFAMDAHSGTTTASLSPPVVHHPPKLSLARSRSAHNIYKQLEVRSQSSLLTQTLKPTNTQTEIPAETTAEITQNTETTPSPETQPSNQPNLDLDAICLEYTKLYQDYTSRLAPNL